MEEKNDILTKIGNKNPFTVPDNYFEDFARDIQNRVGKKKSSEKTVSMSRISIIFSVAAMIAVVVFAARSIFGHQDAATPEAAMIASERFETTPSDWIAYLDESTQIEYFVSNFENYDLYDH